MAECLCLRWPFHTTSMCLLGTTAATGKEVSLGVGKVLPVEEFIINPVVVVANGWNTGGKNGLERAAETHLCGVTGISSRNRERNCASQ